MEENNLNNQMPSQTDEEELKTRKRLTKAIVIKTIVIILLIILLLIIANMEDPEPNCPLAEPIDEYGYVGGNIYE